MKFRTFSHGISRQSKLNLILTIIFMTVVGLMTVGFASYSKLLNVDGLLTVKSQGPIRITNVVYKGGDNSHSTPTFTDTTIDFDLHFTLNTSNPVSSAIYDVTITNDTFFDQVFVINPYIPLVLDTNNNQLIANFGYSLTGAQNGDTIPAGESLTFTLTLSFLPDANGGSSQTIEGVMEISFDSQVTGAFIANVIGNTVGDLRNGNRFAAFTVQVINTYPYARSFQFAIGNNAKFDVSNVNGVPFGTLTIPANATYNYTVYVHEKDDVYFSSNLERANIIVIDDDNSNIDAGRITLNVDIRLEVTDFDAPVISNVVAEIKNTEGEIQVTWEASDESTIDYYVVQIYENGSLLREVDTTNDVGVITLTGMVESSAYYFKVYGRDAHGNTATAAEIASASQLAGACSRSAEVVPYWNFTISYSVTHLEYTDITTARRGTTITTTLTPDGARSGLFAQYSRLPTSITVTMGGTTLNASNGDYAYNAVSGDVTIYNITGDIVITGAATAVTSCLVEGTEITLYDGTKKKVEDIGYGDLLKVWNHDTGQAGAAYPIWIEQTHTSEVYREIEFDDGTILRVVAEHGIFNVDQHRFVSANDAENFNVGVRVYKVVDDRLVAVTVVRNELIEQTIKYYHVVSTRYYNVIANDILTTDGTVILSNLYGFNDDLSWPKTRSIAMADSRNLINYSELADIMPYYMYQGLRVQEAGVLDVAGVLPKDAFRVYLQQNQLAPDMLLAPKTSRVDFAQYGLESNLGQLARPQLNRDGRRQWTISLEQQGKISQQTVAEGAYFVLPKSASQCWHSSLTGACFEPGARVRVWAGTHFKAE